MTASMADGGKEREREGSRVGVSCFDKVFVCANSLYSVVRQAQQWKLPLELRWRGRLQGNLYTKNKKNGKAMHSCAARGAQAAAAIVVGRRQPYNCTSLSQPLKCLSLLAASLPAPPTSPQLVQQPAALRTSICCATMSCA